MYRVFLCVYLATCNLVQAANILDANKLSQKLTSMADDSLGVSFMQQHFNSLVFQNIVLDGENLIEQLQSSLSDRLLESINTVTRLHDAVQDSIFSSGSSWQECCELNDDTLTYASRFRKYIDTDTACERVSPLASSTTRRLTTSVVQVMKENYQNNPSIKWQYFGSEEGLFTIYPASKRADCGDYDSRYRPWYVETATPEPKNVVIVIDKSGSMSIQHEGRSLMEIAKEAANTVLDTMNPNDKVNVVGFSTDISRPSGSRCEDNCYETQLAQATPKNKECLKNFVNSINDGGETEYQKALNAAFDLLQASEGTNSTQREHVILFLTDGRPTDVISDIQPGEDIEEKRRYNIMNTIRTRNEEMGNKIIILTFGLGNLRGDLDKDLLQAMASQDGTRYGVPGPTGDIKAGRFTEVSNPSNLRVQMASYYNFFSSEVVSDRPIFSVPYQAASGIGLLTTAALPIREGGQLKGVVGVDITLQDLLADVTYFQEGQSTYSFIYEVGTKSTGRTLTHPLMPAPSAIEDDPVFVHITSLERDADFEEKVFRVSAGSASSGVETFPSTRTIPRGNSATEGVNTHLVQSTFYWRKVMDTPYIVCLVMEENGKQTVLKPQSPTGNDFLYHRLDLVPPPRRCRHFQRVATTESSVVTFSKEAFKDPIEYISSEETVNRVNAYTNYMNGETESDYFKRGVRDMVVATAKADEIWSQSTQSSSDSTYQHTSFYYIGTENGVFREYPGVRLNKSYDHTIRPWYERAKSNKGYITLSAPYEAAAGSGYVITLAQTIVESTARTGSSSVTSDEVVAVMGMDITLPYFLLLLKQLYPECAESENICFVMDSSGFLVLHKNFVDVGGDIEFGQSHITEVEKTIAQDLIDKGVLAKKQCVNFQKIKLQNYYQVNKPASDINTLLDGNECIRYQLSHIPDTNSYLGIIQRTSHCIPVVCPCVQSKCQYADELGECECPCVSGANYDYCNDLFEFGSDDAPSCTPEIIGVDPVLTEQNHLVNLPQCFATDCSKFTTNIECNAAVSCEWCDEGLYEDQPYCNDIVYSCEPVKAKSTSPAVIAGIVIGVLALIAIVIIIVVVVIVCRKRNHPDLSKEHFPVSYTASSAPSAPSAPPAPSAPGFNPNAPIRIHDTGFDGDDSSFGPDSPSYVDPVSGGMGPPDNQRYYEHMGAQGQRPYQDLLQQQQSVRSGHSYEIPQFDENRQYSDITAEV